MRTGIQGRPVGAIQRAILLVRTGICDFDIEAVFLYPWAVAFTGLDSFGAFMAMAIFIILLAESLIYLWLKGVLSWK